MSRTFDQLMREAPRILTVAAFLIYIGTVITTVAASKDIGAVMREGMTAAFKARIFVLTFIQPMVVPLFLLFGAALLNRLDRGIEGATR
jgi:hypothetical protein